VTWEKADPYAASVGDHRWFKFYEMMNYNANHKEIRELYGKYICREYNKRRSDPSQRLYTFTIYLMQENQNLDGTRTPLPKQAMWYYLSLCVILF
jgi:CRISPR/Cas system CMR-associated protein Cmr1 (group 7 of RAMP superfamily)